jgi:hypothetical protein
MSAPATYAKGDRVLITKGRFEGLHATVWMVTAKELGVDFDHPHRGDGNAVVRTTSVRRLG